MCHYYYVAKMAFVPYKYRIFVGTKYGNCQFATVSCYKTKIKHRNVLTKELTFQTGSFNLVANCQDATYDNFLWQNFCNRGDN